MAVELLEELRRSREMLAETQAIAQVGSFERDLRRDVTEWTDELYRIHGLARETFDPNHADLFELVHVDDRAHLEAKIRECLTSTSTATIEVEYRIISRPAEIRVVRTRARLIRDFEGRALRLVGTVLDVTESKQREHLAVASGRLSTVATLGAGVAHEVNSPLASVLTALDFAIRGIEALASEATTLRVAEIVDALGEARQASRQIRDIVRDLKTFARADSQHDEAVDVVEVLESAIHLVMHEIGVRARVHTQHAEDRLFVRANQAQLATVFVNLLTNAANALPAGAGHEIEIMTTVRDSQIVIAIRDTGVGMAPDVVARIFDPFFTTKPGTSSMGLGLSVCHAVISSLDGKIEVESTPGKGTTFRIELPRIHVETAHVPRSRQTSTRRLRVCVIDDDVRVLNGLQRALSRDHDVVAMSRPMDALERFRAGERFDVIVCDLMMPELTGMDLHAEVERIDLEQAQRMIFISGGTVTERATAFLDSVSNRRLEKPFEIRALLSMITEVDLAKRDS